VLTVCEPLFKNVCKIVLKRRPDEMSSPKRASIIEGRRERRRSVEFKD